MFLGRKRKYFVDYFCTEVTTRLGTCTPEARNAIEHLIGQALTDERERGLEGLDQPLGDAVLAPNSAAARKSVQVLSFAEKVHSASKEQWLADGVAPTEVIEYWNHGALSHFCYTEFDNWFSRISALIMSQTLISDGHAPNEAFEVAQMQTLKLWPLYGPVREPHLAMDERDRPLPVESRMWVDRWRFLNMASDGDAFLALLMASSSFNAAARAARAADPELAGALRAAGLPEPSYGLARAPGAVDESTEQLLAGLLGAPDDDAHEPDYEFGDQFDLGDEFDLEGEEVEDNPEDDEHDEWFVEGAPIIPDSLDWPIPIRLGDQSERLYRTDGPGGREVTYTDSVTVPCGLQLRGLQVPGVLNAAWLDEPNQTGQRLFLEFKQNEAIAAYHPSWINEPCMRIAEYLVDTSQARYIHRSPYRSVNHGWDYFGPDQSDLGLRLIDTDGEEWDFVIPWTTGEPRQDEKAEILSRLKTMLGLFDRQLAATRGSEPDHAR